MNPIRPEATPFTETQKLLLNLLQALQVFTSPGARSVQPTFSKYLFTGVPTSKAEPRFRHQVQILAQILQKASSDAESILVNAGKTVKKEEMGNGTEQKRSLKAPPVQWGFERAEKPPSESVNRDLLSVGIEKGFPLSNHFPRRPIGKEQPSFGIDGERKNTPIPQPKLESEAQVKPSETRLPNASSEKRPSVHISDGEKKSVSSAAAFEKSPSNPPPDGEMKSIAPHSNESNGSDPPKIGPNFKEDPSISLQEKQTFSKGIPSDITVSFPRKTPPQISAPVKNLMQQVRLAIQALSTSLYLERPDKAPVNDILRRIKPLIDQLILVVETQDDMPNGSDGSSRAIRPLPQSPRKNLFHPELPRFLSKDGGERLKNQEIPERSYRPIAQEKQRGEETNENRTEPPSQPKTVPTPFQPGLPKPNFPPDLRNSFPVAREAVEEVEKKNPIQRSEVLELPGAPYTPEKKSSGPHSKKKKKRKGFWTRSEEEEEKPSP